MTNPAQQVAKLFADSTTIALTSFISPYKADRQIARDLHADTKNGETPLPFVEVFIDIPVEEAEKRDPKGLYKKARAGEIKEFTGISAPYEAPENAEIHIHSEKTSVEEAGVVVHGPSPYANTFLRSVSADLPDLGQDTVVYDRGLRMEALEGTEVDGCVSCML